MSTRIATVARRPDGPAWAALRARWPALLFAVVLPIGVFARIAAEWRMPLWFDETYTGTIASQPRFADALWWCLHELTGPGYYLSIWAWEKIAGPSDIALRIPSLILSIAAPLLVLGAGHPDRRLRLFWAIVILLWSPALIAANDARPYAQLFFLGCLQAILFLRLMRAPCLREALGWSAVTALMALTQYHALAISGCEGLAFLLLYRKRALACWPALIPFLGLIAWMYVHLPFVLAYGRGHAAIYAPLSLGVLPYIPTALFGSPLFGLLIIGTIGMTALVRGWHMSADERRRAVTPELLLAWCGVAAVILEIVLGFIHSGFVPRYLTPSMPALLFGCALWMRRFETDDVKLVAFVLIAMAAPFGLGLQAALRSPTMDARHLFNFEKASAWLEERRPSRLVFLWTDGVGTISGDPQTSQVAGFFLHRAGLPTIVTVVHPPLGIDPSIAARTAAGSDPDAAILWIANDEASLVRAVPRIAQQDPRWECREFGQMRATITACRHRLSVQGGIRPSDLSARRSTAA